MYWKTSIIGRCELEPKEKRCPIGDRRFQLFRILQEVNNLRYIDPDTKDLAPLDADQREKLVSKLESSEKLEFKAIRKLLGFPDSVRFNLEKGERGWLRGNQTDKILSNEKFYGSGWKNADEKTRNDIVESLLDPNVDEFEFTNRAKDEWNLNEEQITAMLVAPLPSGYGSLSIKAIEKLLPFLRQGMIYSSATPEDSALHAAGYLRRDQLRRRLFDFLPNPQRTKNTPIGNIPNPVVKRTLAEVRKLVNALLREYGKPDEIHVEMARDLQMGKLKRDEYNKSIREKEKNREQIARTLLEIGQRPSRENILRYQLWVEQNFECLYSGRVISQAQLWGEGGGVEVDHILPQSRTLDDSQSNKVLCFRDMNQDKGDRTPYEWLGHSQVERFESIASRAMRLVKDCKMSFAKYRKIVQKELSTEDFVAKQLVDTAYITKATSEYLRCLFDGDHHVLGLKGRLTADLRWQWGLETILGELPDSPAWIDNTEMRPGKKNRSDHRHHAIDAIVIALTNRSRLQELAQNLRRRYSNGELMAPPWDGFREEVKRRIKSVWVSHKVERKVSGALHEETQYGSTENKDTWVTRKPIGSLSANEIESIRDPAIRNLVISKLREAGIEFGRGKKIDAKKYAAVVSGLRMASGVPIKKVRITKQEQTIRPIRQSKSKTFVKPGSTHHLCIFETTGSTKKKAIFVTMLEAIHRVQRREPVIDRTCRGANTRFVMSLSSRELVLIDDNEERRLLVFKTAASTQGQIYFADHADARRSNEYKKFTFTANTLPGRKVTVDLLGRIKDAND
jgi:CRISPR-associated endonuclease Csn1